MNEPPVPQVRRVDAPRYAAALIYDEAEERLREVMAAHQRAGKPIHARIVAQRVYIAHRAAVAELVHPESPERPVKVCCADCAWYRSLPPESKPALALESV